jgi:glycosyltransferase involved in cell wall biosynthesis/membrane-associated phospholipid phosphatase
MNRPGPTSAQSLPVPPHAVALADQWTGSRATILVVPACLCLFAATALLVDLPLSQALVRDDALLAFDRIIEAAEAFGHATTVILLLLGIACADALNRRSLPRLMLAALGAGLAADVVKLCVSRLRPYDGGLAVDSALASFQGFLPIVTGVAKGNSFPSAHVATAAGLAVALTMLYPKGRAAFAFIAGCVALQRVETGAHFLSDVFVGGAVGYLFASTLFHPRWFGRWFDLKEGRMSAQPAVAPLQLAASHSAESPSLKIWPKPTTIRSLSAVVPVFNEEENVPRMHAALSPVLSQLGIDYEILFINDGSSDTSPAELDRLAETDPHVKVVHFRRNFGQTAAMSAGIQAATGDAIVLLDGDLQNDPTDIPMMLAKLDEGYDLIHGWRKDRHDRFLDRKLPSLIANWIISKVTQFPVHDLGCTLKVVRRDIAQELHLFGEMHRFIPILAHARGARCAEVVTKHHARQFGQSKYGISRTVRVIMDLITVRFLTRYLVSPMRFFGQAGFAAMGLSAVTGAVTIGMKLVAGVDMTGNPLLLGTVFTALVGVQFFCLGVLGELAARTYFKSAGPGSFAIRRTVNLGEDHPRLAA